MLQGIFKSFKGLKYLFLFFNELGKFVKQHTVSKLYWGRGNLYKQTLHGTILLITGIVFFTGISTRLFGLSNSGIIEASNNALGNVDVLAQGSGLQSVLVTDPSVSFKVAQYTVKNGDTLQSIANQFNVSKDTIKWANPDVYGSYDAYNSEKVKVDQILQVPEITGVIYTVQPNDTLDSVLSKTKGDRFQVIDINQLEGPDYSLAGKAKLLIPSGSLQAPAAPPTVFAYNIQPQVPTTYHLVRAGNIATGGKQPLNGVVFSNPMSDPDCAGYVWIRGFSPWHNGVDLSKRMTCPIRAACDGIVDEAGWENGGQGFNVRINCGNGVMTSYYHSNGEIVVKKGDKVSRGQFIMMEGMSGNATGPHLHLGLRLNGNFIDPSPYVPY